MLQKHSVKNTADGLPYFTSDADLPPNPRSIVIRVNGESVSIDLNLEKQFKTTAELLDFVLYALNKTVKEIDNFGYDES